MIYQVLFCLGLLVVRLVLVLVGFGQMDVVGAPFPEVQGQGFYGIKHIAQLVVGHYRVYRHAQPAGFGAGVTVVDEGGDGFAVLGGHIEQVVPIGARTGASTTHLYPKAIVEQANAEVVV